MNERIQELAEKATLATYYNVMTGLTSETFDKEKFAELIVRECADFVDQNTLEDQGMWGKIIRHFGVKE